MSDFKAIETVYQGNRHRSRLEAKWGVFFTALGIEYRYEPEGYVLEGTPYLPDFFLPEHDCFIEIKGQEPTDDEREKARLLALYTAKEVYIFSGDIWMPGEKGSYKGYIYQPPRLYTYLASDGLGGSSTQIVKVPPAVLIILEKLEKAGINLRGRTHHPDWNDCLTLELASFVFERGKMHDFSEIFETIQEQQRVLTELHPLIKQYEQDLFDALTLDEGWKIDFFGTDDDAFNVGNYCWQECPRCGELSINMGNTTRHYCGEDKSVFTSRNNTPHLIEAYTSARQARFGKEGRG